MSIDAKSVGERSRGGLAAARVSLLMLLAGCAQMPTGPLIAVMPAPYTLFEVFMQDDQLCAGWAV